MAKKGNMNVDKKDFNFDNDEMFPLDDSVYDDDDDLAGFKFDPNDSSSSAGGVKGFFANTIKSIRGVGVDFVDNFLPEAVSLTDDMKMAASDSKDKFVEMKDRALSQLSSFKSNATKKNSAEVKGEVKSGFKGVWDNIKKGKFYTADRDRSIDMNAFLGDDEEGDDSDREPEDTSGKMTTTFNYKKKRRKNAPNLIISNDNSRTIHAMGEIQEAASIANAKVQTKLANAQIRNSNQNYYETIKVLNNIADNVYGISDFLTHYGKTNLKAQLEFDSKALAFLTDQRAILKDILVSNNRLAGIINDSDNEEDEEEKSKFLRNGNFDFSKYLGHVGNNLKNMFLGTQLGSMVDMGSMSMSMMGKDSGLNINPMQLAKSAIKSSLMGSLIGEENKNKLERLNNLFGNMGGLFVSKMNKFRESDNTILRFLGETFGSESGINKAINLNKEDLNTQSPLDIKTKETINEVIPGYLAQITAALTGSKLTYFNHESKEFETFESIEKKYKMTQEAAINGDTNFSSIMDQLEGKIDKNRENLSKEILEKSIKKFKENIIESKTAIDPSRLLENGDYRDKMFRGIDDIAGRNSNRVKNLIGKKLFEMESEDNGRALMDFNNAILSVSSRLESSAKEFKENAIKNGGLTAIAQINEKERIEELEYELKHSMEFSEERNSNNALRKERARFARLQAKSQMSYAKLGKIDMLTQKEDEGFGLSGSVIEKMNSLYELLVGGIAVYPVTDANAYNKRISELNSIGSNISSIREAKKAEKLQDLKDERELRDQNLKSALEMSEAQKRMKLAQNARFSNSMLGRIGEAMGLGRAIGTFIGLAATPLTWLDKGTEEYINEGSASEEKQMEAAKKLAEESNAKSKEILSAVVEKIKPDKNSRFGKITAGLTNTKNTIVDFTKKKTSAFNAKLDNAILNQHKKAEAAQKKRRESGGFLFSLSSMFTDDNKARAKLMNIGEKRGIKVFVDPDYFEDIAEKSRVKILNAIRDANASIVFDIDETTDVAFAKESNLDEDEKQMILDYDIYFIGAKLDNLKRLSGVLGNSKFVAEKKISRMTKSELAENRAIKDYNDRDKELNELDKKKFNFKEIDNTVKNKRGRKSTKDRQELADNISKAVNSKVSNAPNYKYKLLTKITSPSTAGKIFLQKGIENEIDQLLASGDKDAIFAFANRIKSKNEGASIRAKNKLEYLDPKFASRMNSFLNDPALINGGVSIKDASRSPLLQFALYSKGRVDPAITDELMKYAGIKEGINYYPESIRTIMGPDGITVRSLSSNHLTGRAVDLNNGSMAWGKLGSIAKKYGIKWAGNSDKPHFEFDTQYKDGQFNYGYDTGPAPKPKGYGEIPKNNMVAIKRPRASATTSGTPVEIYQHDPVDTKVSGTPRSTELPKTQIGLLGLIYQKVEQIADNTTKMGIGIGIPGVVGKGLIGKVGAKAKDIAKSTYGFAKDTIFGKEDEDGKRSGGLLGLGKKATKKGLEYGGKAWNKVKDILLGEKKGEGDDAKRSGGIIGFLTNSVLGKKGEDGKRSGGFVGFAKGILSKGKAKGSAGVNKAKEFLVSKNIITKEDAEKLSNVDIIKLATKNGFVMAKGKTKNLVDKGKEKLTEAGNKAKEFLVARKILTKDDADNLSNGELVDLASKNGMVMVNGESVNTGLIGRLAYRAKKFTDGLGGAKDAVAEKRSAGVNKAKEFLVSKNIITKEDAEKLSNVDIIKLATKNGFVMAKDKGGELFGKGKEKLGQGFDFVKNLIFGEEDEDGKRSGGLMSKAKGIFGSAVGVVKGIGSTIGGKIKGRFGSNFQTTVLERLANMDTNLAAIGTKLGAAISTPKNPVAATGSFAAHREGSYEDQKADKEHDEAIKRDVERTEAIKGMAATIGTPESAVEASDGNKSPKPNIASVLMATYQNSEKQNQTLDSIEKNGGNGKGGKQRGGGLLNLFSKGAGTAAGKMAAVGGAVTVAAAGAGAAMIYKQAKNKKKELEVNKKHATLGEKIGSAFGASGAGNYDAAGNEITDKGMKAGQGFGLNQAIHIGTAAKAISKIPAVFAKLASLITKIFTSPKIAKLVGPKNAAKIAKTFTTAMTKSASKAGSKLMAKIGQKVASFCAKVSQPIGWGVMIAQLVYDITTGMAEANRYFQMGKGMKPTIGMRLASGLAKALSGNLTFGLIPPETIANLMFKIIGSDATKQQMAEAQEFDRQRARIMEVEYKRLVEFETMTWTEMMFGGDKKRATILGFMKGKKDTKGKERFKNWFDNVYKPLDDMYKDMVKQYGGKVNKKINPEDTEQMENRDKFRKDYLKAAEDYMKQNNLKGLGPLGEKATGEEESGNVEESTATAADEGSKRNVSRFNTVRSPEVQKMYDEAEANGESIPSISDAIAEQSQADGINISKMNDRNYIRQWSNFAKDNENKSAKLEGVTALRAGVSKRKSIGSRIMGSAFKGVRNLAAKLTGTPIGKAVASGASFIFKKLRGPADAIAAFVSNRKESEKEISSKFTDPSQEKDIISLQSKIVDKNALGQQTSAANLSPEFAQRVEAFLKDPRVQGHGVKIREGYRSPATQLAYYSKGRASPETTDKLMKMAGFKSGIGFWSPSFRKPGDYITWTLASNHFNGTAVDLEPGDIGYDTLGKIAAEYGIDWGGNWSTPDKPHFEMGPANFTPSSNIAKGSTTEAQAAQADTFNYDKMLNPAIKQKNAYKSSGTIIKGAIKPYDSARIASISNSAKNRFNSGPIGSANKADNSVVTSNLIISKFDELLKTSTEGVDIMRDLYSEQKRHNKVEEDYLKNIIQGLAALGGIISATSGGGTSFTNPGSINSITNGIFDQIAKGI